MRYLKQVDAPFGPAGAVAITSGQAYSSKQTGSDVRQSLQTDRSQIDAGGNVTVYGAQSVKLSATDVVSCPSVRNRFFAESQPLFFQRSALRGWSLIGMRHFFVLRCAFFEQKLTRTQALPLADADSTVGVGLKSCLKRPTS